MSVGTTQAMGDYVATKMESFRAEYFNDMLPIEQVVDGISKLDLRSLSHDDRRIVDLFLQHAKSWKAPNATPGVNTSESDNRSE